MSETMKVTVTLAIEAKDEYANPATGRWQPGKLPRPGEARRHVQDIVADETRRNMDLGWRVTNIERYQS